MIDVKLEKICSFISKLMKQDTAPVIVVDGKERMAGKSTLSYWIAYLISKYNGTQLTPENFVWDSSLVIDKIWSLPRNGCIILDEGGIDYYSRRAMSSSNVSLNQAIMVCGLQNQAIIINIPSFWDLDSFIRDRRCDYWFNGRYQLYGSHLVRGIAKVKLNLSQSEWKATPFWETYDYVNFDDMPPDFRKLYRKRKEAESRRRIQREEDEVKNSKSMLFFMLWSVGRFLRRVMVGLRMWILLICWVLVGLIFTN